MKFPHETQLFLFIFETAKEVTYYTYRNIRTRER